MKKKEQYTLLWRDAPWDVRATARNLQRIGKTCRETADIVKMSYGSVYNALYKPEPIQHTPKPKPEAVIITLDEYLTKRIYSFCYRRPAFTLGEFLDKIGPNPRCYLTGVPIDLGDYASYQLDHILPRSRGGDNSLDNCGLASTVANRAKSNLTVEEFRALCRSVLEVGLL